MDRRLKELITSKPLYFTEHAKFKMRQYGLSEARVKRVLRAPARVEAGIAPKTVAVMQPAHPRHSERSGSGGKNPAQKGMGSFTESIPTEASGFRMTNQKKRPQELWVMYADTKKARRIIAVWRYPGVSPVREPPPFPEDLMK